MATISTAMIATTTNEKRPNSAQAGLFLTNKSLFVKGGVVSNAGPNIAAIAAAVVTKAVTTTFGQVSNSDREFWS